MQLSTRLEVCHADSSQDAAPLKSYKKRKKKAKSSFNNNENVDECNKNEKIKKFNATEKVNRIRYLLIRTVSGVKNPLSKRRVIAFLFAFAAVFVAFVLQYELHTLHGFARFWMEWENIDLQAEQCTIDMPSYLQDYFRPPVDCSFCRDISEVERKKNITPDQFEERYAYSGRPVVVVDGQRNWTADIFSFNFFKSIYGEDSPALFNFERECQFFPYETEFRNLREVFNMSQKRREKNPWYIGWSNCDSYAANVLRNHYHRPYFLPELSESSKTDWIFMGTPGHGAHIHIDHVGNPSWQAQIKGQKLWDLEPPPECYFECVNLQVIVNAGEIIVLDTNIWYHGTTILNNGLSITIGSEYD